MIFNPPVGRELAAICLVMMEIGNWCFSASLSYSLITNAATTSIKLEQRKGPETRLDLWPTYGQMYDVIMNVAIAHSVGYFTTWHKPLFQYLAGAFVFILNR
jgi:hypothetical protein